MIQGSSSGRNANAELTEIEDVDRRGGSSPLGSSEQMIWSPAQARCMSG
jgi:hypothetical protein